MKRIFLFIPLILLSACCHTKSRCHYSRAGHEIRSTGHDSADGLEQLEQIPGPGQRAVDPRTADAMATNGMKAAGYQYVNIDDLWQGDAMRTGTSPDKTRFPSGIKALADYVHSKGLKLGIYSDAGTKTCGGRPGSEITNCRTPKPMRRGMWIISNTTGAMSRN